MQHTRRRFLRQSGAALAGSWLGLHSGVLAAASEARKRQQAGQPWQQLSPAEAHCLGAIADQIYPPDGDLGASELGAVHFMDSALGGFMADALPAIRQGVAELDRRSADAGNATGFAALATTRQGALLREIEEGAFFALVHTLTLWSIFAMPTWGGNHGGAGWAQIGFEQRHAWLPPFGHYDAQFTGDSADDGN